MIEIPAGIIDRVVGWIYEWSRRHLERRRQKSEETRERLRQLHSLLTQWVKSYPQFVEWLGLVRKVTHSPGMSLQQKAALLDTMKTPVAALAAFTPDLFKFTADNYLLLPEDVGSRLKQIESLADVTKVVLGQEDGDKKSASIRERCKDLMDLIERDYFKREGR